MLWACIAAAMCVSDSPNHPAPHCCTAAMIDIAMLCSRQQIKGSFDLPDAMRSYFLQLFPLNPSAIVPSGPTLADLGLEGTPVEHSDTGDAFHRQQAAQPVVAV
jgi:hypothetical protein